MPVNLYPDPDIVDYPHLWAAYSGFALIMPNMPGVLPVPIDPPGKREGRGARPLSETQADLRKALCCSVLGAYATLRAADPDRSELDIEEEIDPYVRAWMTVRTARETGREIVRGFLGISSRELDLRAQAAFAQAEDKQAHIAGELGNVQIVAQAYARARVFDAGVYDAFHGRAPGSFDDKLAKAVNATPEQAPLDQPKAAQVALLSGVNPAVFWPSLWQYRYPLEVCTSMHCWLTRSPATLYVEEYYTLFRCVESAPAKPKDPWDHLKNLVRSMVEQHVGIDIFMAEAVTKLERHGLLRPRPETVHDLFARSVAIDDDTPDESTCELVFPYRTMRLV